MKREDSEYSAFEVVSNPKEVMSSLETSSKGEGSHHEELHDAEEGEEYEEEEIVEEVEEEVTASEEPTPQPSPGGPPAQAPAEPARPSAPAAAAEPSSQASARDAAGDTAAGAAPSQPATAPDAPSTATPEDESFAALRALEAQVLDKFSSGLKSLQALGATGTVTEATTNISKLAGGLTAGLSSGFSSWFGSGDAAPASKAKSMQLQTSKASDELAALFGLDDSEQLVESFKCKLLQTYACSHNSYTPCIQMAFQGTLHVTDKHVLFSIEERGKQLPIKVPLESIKASSRQLPAQRGGSDLLRLDLQTEGAGSAGAAKQHVSFKDFEGGGGALDSALALIEHLTSPE